MAGSPRAPTGETELIEAGLVLRSIGYRGTPIPGVPFDERRATIHNDGGRVTTAGRGEPMPGVYTAGWIKRGPSGVIGTNKKCAQETVDRLLEDVAAGVLPEPTRRTRSPCSPRWRSAASRWSTTRAGRPSTRTSAAAASRTAGRA